MLFLSEHPLPLAFRRAAAYRLHIRADLPIGIAPNIRGLGAPQCSFCQRVPPPLADQTRCCQSHVYSSTFVYRRLQRKLIVLTHFDFLPVGAAPGACRSGAPPIVRIAIYAYRSSLCRLLLAGTHRHRLSDCAHSKACRSTRAVRFVGSQRGHLHAQRRGSVPVVRARCCALALRRLPWHSWRCPARLCI